MYLPEQMGTVLGIHVQLDVARLIDEIDAAVASVVGAGPQLSHTPSSHTVGTAAEVALFIGQDGAVAVWECHACSQVEGKGVAVVYPEALGQVKVELYIFGVCDVEECILVLAVLACLEQVAHAI